MPPETKRERIVYEPTRANKRPLALVDGCVHFELAYRRRQKVVGAVHVREQRLHFLSQRLIADACRVEKRHPLVFSTVKGGIAQALYESPALGICHRVSISRSMSLANTRPAKFVDVGMVAGHATRDA